MGGPKHLSRTQDVAVIPCEVVGPEEETMFAGNETANDSDVLPSEDLLSFPGAECSIMISCG